ncbi:MAG: RNA methyltransferase [Lachnospiraceae bacterium]|nr:RNA methyltransferase [Lachnospiraceae bacterium]
MITSSSNPQIKNVLLLNSKAKIRREQDVFVVEGTKMFLEVPVSHVVKIFVSETYYKNGIHKSKIEKYPFEVVADDIFKKISDTKTPQGILTIVKQFHYEESNLFEKEKGLFLVLEGIQDPGNLGTMIRTGEGASISGIIMDRNTSDIYNPKVIRGTMGSIYRVPFYYSDDLKETIEHMKRNNIQIIAAHLNGEKSYTEENYLTPTAFLIGNEGNGLSDDIANEADGFIRIPMGGKVESLNAAVAASLLIYEADRQRRQ